MAKRKCSAKVGSLSADLRVSPIKLCTRAAVVIETHSWEGATYVNAYCARHRNNPKDVSPSVNWKVEAI